MSPLFLIIIGAAAGFLATRLMRMETGILPTIAIGIAGALLGGIVLQVLIRVMGALAGFVGAVLGALVVLWLWKLWQSKR